MNALMVEGASDECANGWTAMSVLMVDGAGNECPNGCRRWR
jgi:hypothetical protein